MDVADVFDADLCRRKTTNRLRAIETTGVVRYKDLETPVARQLIAFGRLKLGYERAKESAHEVARQLIAFGRLKLRMSSIASIPRSKSQDN